MKVLVVEDDKIILEGLTIALTQDGYEVASASTVVDALELVQRMAGELQIYLLDVMLPDGDGYQICKEIRKVSDAPILFLTACDDEVHTVLALEQGADDYIAKPFRIRELLARMKAILRRAGAMSTSSVMNIGENQFDMQSGKLYRNGENILLTAMEYRLLLIFINHRGQTLTRKQLLNDIWDVAGDYVNDNTLTVYIKRLREKLGEEAGMPVIETVRGIGYRMN